MRKTGSADAFETLGDPQPISKANSTCPGAWALDGDSGAPAGSFLGTVDYVPLRIRVGNQQIAELTAFVSLSAPNIKFGPENLLRSNGTRGATIGGGGPFNLVSDTLGTVAGGSNNTAGDDSNTGQDSDLNASHATVSGGASNQAGGKQSVVPGGLLNCAGGDHSFAAGRRAKIRRSRLSIPTISGCAGVPSSETEFGDIGTFVWADSQDVDFVSSGPNQYLARASGGVAFNGTPANPGFELSVFGNDPDNGFVEMLLTPKPSLNGNTGESIEFGVGPGGAGNNDANFRITQRNALGGFVQTLTIGSDGVTNVKNGAVGNVSDARLKKNVRGIQQPLDTFLALSGHVFEYIDPAKSMNTPGPRMGFIAQEVKQTLPNWVTTNDNGYLQVSTIGFEALAVEAMRDLKLESDARSEALERDNAGLRVDSAKLRGDFDRLVERLQRLEARASR